MDMLLDLPLPGLDGIRPFSLLTGAYEQEVAKRNGGVDLSSKLSINESAKSHREFYNSLSPGFLADDYFNALEKIASKFPDITEPCSMIIKSPEELAAHMVLAYQVSYGSYVLSTLENIKGSFPNMCCGPASRSVMRSLMLLGYPNAIYMYSISSDHGYAGLPFLMEPSQTKGIILVDPTSSQLWFKENGPRNAVTALFGERWEYRTDWEGGKNLYPEVVAHIGNLISSKGGIRDYEMEMSDDFFKQAFSNPVHLK